MSATKVLVEWRTADVKVSVGRSDNNPRMRTVAAYVADAFPGLAVTPFQATRGDQHQLGRWCITHLDSGMTVVRGGFPSVEAAQRATEEIGPLADWTQDGDTLMTMPKRGKARRACQRLSAECDG